MINGAKIALRIPMKINLLLNLFSEIRMALGYTKSSSTRSATLTLAQDPSFFSLLQILF